MESTRWTLYSFKNLSGSDGEGLTQYTLISNLNGKDVVAGVIIQVTTDRIYFLGDPEIVNTNTFLTAMKDWDLRVDDTLRTMDKHPDYVEEEDIENEEESDAEEQKLIFITLLTSLNYCVMISTIKDKRSINMIDDKTPKLIVLYGGPAAGKSTYAKSVAGAYVVSADEIRYRLYGSQDKFGNGEEIWESIVYEIRSNLSRGKTVIYDACNLKKSYRLDVLDAVKDIECWKTLLRINTPIGVCQHQHKQRGRNIPWETLKKYFDIKEYPDMSEGWDEIKDKSFVPWAKRFYLASPFFEGEARENAMKISEWFRENGYEVFVPMEHKIPNAWDLPNYAWGESVFNVDINNLNACSAVICLSYGRISSAGTNFEAGYAYGIGKPVIVIEMPGVELMSLMLSNGSHAVIRFEEFQSYDWENLPEEIDKNMEQK